MLFRRFSLRSGRKQQSPKRNKSARRPGSRFRPLGFQRLESRELLSGVSLLSAGSPIELVPLAVSADTGEKPQSKVWEHADNWWSVLPDTSGTWLWRLDNTTWNRVLRLSTKTGIHADVKAVGDLAHVLLYGGTASQLITVAYSPSAGGSYIPWSNQPSPIAVTLSSGVETASIDVDSTGRIWLASDAQNTVEVRYSDFPYASFSSPITIASGISSDDISTIRAFPNGAVGVLWSNQNTKRFGFRVHRNGDSPTTWLADEIPASQSALSAGGGMADDHINVAVASNGTVYAAVKTSYDSSSYPKVALLVRRPSGTWDPLYAVDTRGTRPIVMLNEQANRLVVAYTSSESGGPILAKESPLDVISFGPVQTLIAGTVNNVTSTKGNLTDELVAIAAGSGKARGSLIRWSDVIGSSPPPAPEPEVETPPSVPITVSFQDGVAGYQGTQDTTILSGSARTNFGAGAELQIDGSPDEATLIRWELSAIPAGSQVQSAAITVNVTNTSPHTYEIYELKRAWAERQTTWSESLTAAPWQTAGAQGAADRGSTVLGTVTSTTTGKRTIELNQAGLAALQRWIDQPSSNFGLIFQDYVSASDGLMLSSREATNAALRPMLTVTYAPQTTPTDPGQPPAANQPPQVNAGSDRQIQLPVSLSLSGTVQDDGLPQTGTLSVHWSQLSGPGTVQFANPAAAQTVATFSQAGSYVLRLTAHDGQFTASDDVSVVVLDPSPTASGLVASWQFNETAGMAIDASGLGNHGTLQGNPVRVAGRSGNAMSLDGVDDRVVVPDAPSLDARGAITLSAWLRPSKIGTQYVIKKADHSAIDGYELSLSGNGTVFVRFNNASAGDKYRVDSKTRYPTNGSTWIHVAATYDGSTIRLYINGILEGSLAASFQIGVNDLALGIGAEASGYRPMKGVIDDVRLYTRALSSSEILALAAV